ncbi:hypothetical protein QFC22_000064 [Naganishia vaughanmartiniae]|uniref:Uncharacterized protein n=1 Tax=Naganishia vaughanmartiniae TaxID=1424756 RepID=A0ACC2XQ15_9TREE|nr:hypothetical protein QFC22_000064 [Naganishia vaughanmartiniae]
MIAFAFLLPALTVVAASPFQKRASSNAGATSSDIFPPTATKVNSALFPGETVIGYPGVTATGVEPLAIQTAAAYPNNNEAFFPLVGAKPADNNASSNFSIFKQWGNLSPWYTVNSSFYGLPSASPLIPDQCEITQVHLLYRHGARYPTTGSLPTAFSAKLQQATKSMPGFNATGDLSFLNDWTYKLGAELLTPFGRLQNFELGVEFRQLYGHLLNNFTEQGTLPVFRTESQDRMVKTAQNFAAGFFGVPEFLDEVNIEIVVEATGFNNTGAPYGTCKNSNVASRGSIGSTAATNFSATAFAPTVSRLQASLTGVNLTTTDIVAMLQLCSYETDALGYSQFCKLFTQEEFRDYEYYYDIAFYYNNGFGSPVAAAQGKGYLEEFVSRFEHRALSEYNSTTNSTLDPNAATFPLNQSIFSDATHEVVVLDTLTALNLSAIFSSGPPPLTGRPEQQHSFVASQVVPFATHLVIQVMECSQMSPTKQVRFLLNDAVLPIDKSYPGCPQNAQGLCSFDTVLSALRQRVKEIDFDYDCFGNYTAKAGVDYNGRAPRS